MRVRLVALLYVDCLVIISHGQRIMKELLSIRVEKIENMRMERNISKTIKMVMVYTIKKKTETTNFFYVRIIT